MINIALSLIPYRSNIRLGAFRKIKYLKIFQDSYSVYGDLTTKSKFLKSIFLLSCCKELHKLFQNDPSVKWIDEILAELWHFEFHKNFKKGAESQQFWRIFQVKYLSNDASNQYGSKVFLD